MNSDDYLAIVITAVLLMAYGHQVVQAIADEKRERREAQRIAAERD